MLELPRPKHLGDCREEARPCPWVACRHHLLLEVANATSMTDRRPTTLRANAPRFEIRDGRRPGLRASAAAVLVRQWIDDAVELLSRMEYTCTFDFVRDYPQGAPAWLVARVLGVTEAAIDKITREGDSEDQLRRHLGGPA